MNHDAGTPPGMVLSACTSHDAEDVGETGARSEHPRRARFLLVALLGLAGAAVGGQATSAEGPAVTAVGRPATPVRVRAVERSVPSDGVPYAGTIRPASQVDLAFRASGYVREIVHVPGIDGRPRHVQEGDRVARGTVLARIRETDAMTRRDQVRARLAQAEAARHQARAQVVQAEAARAQLQAHVRESDAAAAQAVAQAAEAQAALEQAAPDLDRAARLLARGSQTRPEYDAARARHDTALARVDAARAQIERSRAAADRARAELEGARAAVESARAQLVAARSQVDGAHAQLEESAIGVQDAALVAPMDGIVLRRAIEPGSLVGPTAAAFVLADTTSVKAAFGVPDTVVTRLALGHPVALTADALPGVELRGRITSIAPSADTRSRVFEVEVTLPNPRDRLKTGMIVTARLAPERPAGPAAGELVVPLSAVVRDGHGSAGYAVMVVEARNGGHVARRRPVRLGDAFGNAVAVTAGLRLGEQVIVTGTALVKDGEAVRLIP